MSKVSVPKTKIYIADEQPAQTTVSGYDGLTWTLVAGVLDYGDVGPEYKPIEYETVDDGLIHRLKGSLDNGTMTLKLARDPANAGQSAIISALADYDNYNFKIEFNDKPTGVGAKPTRLCFAAKVMSYKTNIGGGSKLLEATVQLAIDGDVLEGARVVGS